jgi:hypothetical protein
MHECNAQTLILPPFGPKRWDVTQRECYKALLAVTTMRHDFSFHGEVS